MDDDDGSRPLERRLTLGIVAVAVLLTLTLVALAAQRPTQTATPKPVVVTQKVVDTSTAPIQLPQVSLVRGADGGGAVLTDTFGTVALPTGLSIVSVESDVRGATVSLTSGVRVLLGTLLAPLSDLSEMAYHARIWANETGFQGMDDSNGAVQTSALGFAGWCASSYPAGALGRGCFYPTDQGSTYIWVWATSDADIQTLLDHYVPGP